MSDDWEYDDDDYDYGRDAYHSPERFGLEIFASVECDQSYAFNIFCIWKNADGSKFYYASDSGCSCPSPFENYTGLSDLTEAMPADIRTALTAWADYDPSGLSVSQVVDTLDKLAQVRPTFGGVRV